jgi:transposase
MTEKKKRKVYSPEFKAKVGLEALEGVKTINEIGQAYGVHPVQVGQWKKAIQEEAKSLFEGKRGPKPVVEHQEPDRLFSEIGKLKMELDWLKKSPGSAAIFDPVVQMTAFKRPVYCGQFPAIFRD